MRQSAWCTCFFFLPSYACPLNLPVARCTFYLFYDATIPILYLYLTSRKGTVLVLPPTTSPPLPKSLNPQSHGPYLPAAAQRPPPPFPSLCASPTSHFHLFSPPSRLVPPRRGHKTKAATHTPEGVTNWFAFVKISTPSVFILISIKYSLVLYRRSRPA